MKKNILLLILTFLFQFAFSQDKMGKIPVKVKTTEKVKNKVTYSSLGFSISDSKGGYFTGKYFQKSYTIEHFDKNSKRIDQIDIKTERYITQINDGFVKDGKVYLLEKNHNNETQKVEFNVLISPLSKLSFKRKKLGSVKYKELKDIKKKVRPLYVHNFGLFVDFALSKNSEYFAAIVNTKLYYKIFVFNNKLTKLYSHKIKKVDGESHISRSMLTKLIRVYDYELALDNEGNTFYLQRKTGNSYSLHKLSDQGIEKVDIKFNSVKTVALKIGVKNNKIHCAGFYQSKDDFGTASFIANQSNIKEHDLFTSSFKNSKEIKMPTKFSSIFKIPSELRQIHITQDNKCYIIAEQISSSRFGNTSFNSDTEITYGDLIISEIDENGKLIWSRKISKNQNGNGRFLDPYGSFFSTINKDKLYLMLNINTVKKEKKELLFQGKKTSKKVYGITFDDKGNYQYSPIIYPDFRIQTTKGIQIDEGDFIFYGKWKKNNCFKRVKL